MLDIIIPAYKDPEGLLNTLQSVYYPEFQNWIHITVIDDASPISYSEIEKQYPQVTFYHLPENRGPGYARQYGIDHTTNPYIMFVDCGDIIAKQSSLIEIKNKIELYPQCYLFLFSWYSEKTGKTSSMNCRSTQGWLYKRSLFRLYNIKFCTSKEGGYAHEDVGFNRTCVAIVRAMSRRDNAQYSMFFPIVVYRKINNLESITNTGNYRLNKEIPGLAANATLSIQELEQNKIDINILLEELNAMMCSLYKNFLRCSTVDKSSLIKHWKTIRKYYFNVYKKYEMRKDNNIYLIRAFTRAKNILHKFSDNPNIKDFIKDLNQYEECPIKYLT